MGCDSVVQHGNSAYKTYWKVYLFTHTINCSSRIDFLVLSHETFCFFHKYFFFSFFIKTKFHLSEQWKIFKSPYPCKQQTGEWRHSSTWAGSPKYSLIQPHGHPNSTDIDGCLMKYSKLCLQPVLAELNIHSPAAWTTTAFKDLLLLCVIFSGQPRHFSS